MALEMMDNLFKSYSVIDKIDIEENALKIMGAYNPSELLTHLIKQLEKGW